jgi:hypothetical protein
MGVIAFALAGLVVTAGGVTIDWSAGTLRVHAGAPGSLRAPSPQIARAQAERLAKRRGAERLLAAFERLPVVGGGTVRDRLERDAAQRKRLERLLESPSAEGAEYASDGGVELAVRVSLDDLAGALESEPKPADDEEAPDAAARPERKVRGARILLVKRGEPAVVPGAAVRFYKTLAEAKRDDRLGPKPQIVRLPRLSGVGWRGPIAVVLGAS